MTLDSRTINNIEISGSGVLKSEFPINQAMEVGENSILPLDLEIILILSIGMKYSVYQTYRSNLNT